MEGEGLKKFFKETHTIISWQRIWLIVMVVFVLFGIIFVGLISYARSYDGRVIPGVYVGESPVGGMQREDVKIFLQDMNDKLISEGLHVVIKDELGMQNERIIYPVFVTESNSIELLTMDVNAEVDQLLAYGKQGGIISRAVQIIKSRIGGGVQVPLSSVQADEGRIHEAVNVYIKEFESPAQNAGFQITSIEPFEYTMVSSSAGITYQYENIHQQFIESWSVLEVPYVTLQPIIQEPEILSAAVYGLEDKLEKVFGSGSLQLSYTDPQTSVQESWIFSPQKMAELIELRHEKNQEEKQLVFGLKEKETKEFLEQEIATDIVVEAQDAKFKIEDGKVIEFQGSRPGVALDIDRTYADIDAAFVSRSLHSGGSAENVQITTIQTDPVQSTNDVNNLGIGEVLGQGVSIYAGSPANRIKNIRNGVNKLNGILIAPGEEFSTIEHTKPYTLDGGYLPELVIKGDEIKPEIGGGLCQIGSTLFRMAMNSGMEITERRNHSLVVDYYNDLTNGLPGTDATIYDPAPDFKFKNDTGHYVLIEARMDTIRGRLVFTLWGTSDGRVASYSAPVVHRWINPGPSRTVETTKLAPGERSCQHAYRGADASFTYTKTLPGGETIEQVFESHYRPLPQICLVGVEKVGSSSECVEGEECINAENTTTEIEETASLDETGDVEASESVVETE